MPPGKIISAHPAHLEFLSQIVDAGESKTVESLERACRILDGIDELVEGCRKDLGNENAVFVDPTVVRSEKDWNVRKEIKRPDGTPAADPNMVYMPELRLKLSLTVDEHKYVTAVFERVRTEKGETISKRLLMALHTAISNPESVILEASAKKE